MIDLRQFKIQNPKFKISLMHLIESPRLYVRYYTMNDLDNFFRLNGDEEVMRFIRAPKNREECAVFLQEVIDRYTKKVCDMRLSLHIKDTGEFIGSFAIIPIDHTTDIQLGYSLLKKDWGKGYATEIVEAGLNYAGNVLKLEEIKAVTMLKNIASQKVLMKNGFVFEKKTEMEGEKVNVYNYKF
jgi:ribosomal-protein-alanine N-acetyltransferase